MSKVSVLFVCLGNICRSPAAEGFFKHLLVQENKAESFYIDSAGTSAYHEGAPADGRMQEAAKLRGYELESISRAFDFKKDFEKFDYIITMDHDNFQDVLDLAPDSEAQEKVTSMVSYCTQHDVNHVPDPYYKGMDGFELTLDIIEDACEGLFEKLMDENKL